MRILSVAKRDHPDYVPWNWGNSDWAGVGEGMDGIHEPSVRRLYQGLTLFSGPLPPFPCSNREAAMPFGSLSISVNSTLCPRALGRPRYSPPSGVWYPHRWPVFFGKHAGDQHCRDCSVCTVDTGTLPMGTRSLLQSMSPGLKTGIGLEVGQEIATFLWRRLTLAS